ncbi:tRNA pseudouridine(38/39) synthase isoform X1 [Selaginella moellendorffii]|uniref:tRNA pseudouridine(38/39) synthase isoform X1 n=1 Tax=Selaginella moellendorffii TaxID=88036 RepID=UPI000D1C9BEC|nr:tRNA pseudouridine(38/39) synthase isoform X1 [Selaginella moellendorffii]|eukprot:XP_024537068.1 tRNA pseudouridine(38/39) synthase isoform X1 [Selaginella moellendorffii]
MEEGRIRELENDVAALTARIKALEMENANLTARFSQQHGENQSLKSKRTHKNHKKENQGNFKRRFVALKIMYIGSCYHGFASQGCAFKTVESEIFAALQRTNLVVGSIADANYSRCGRTDRGVSATAQVIALYLRSKKKALDDTEESGYGSKDRVTVARSSREEEEMFAAETDDDEIDYVSSLNRALPADIRVLGWCPVPPGFHARFSCLYREYKYFFIDDGLNIDAMKQASQRLLGEHDFRNFCKMDADNIHNYTRQILAFDILPIEECWEGRSLWVMHVRGNAFLWHQVRCMAAVLFMIGRGHETLTIIDDLLDVDKTMRKPQYVMAPELPLVLQSCAFQGLRFYCRPESKAQIHRHLLKHLDQTLLTAALISEGMLELDCPDSIVSFSKTNYVPLLSRPTERKQTSTRVSQLTIVCFSYL